MVVVKIYELDIYKSIICLLIESCFLVIICLPLRETYISIGFVYVCTSFCPSSNAFLVHAIYPRILHVEILNFLTINKLTEVT